MKKMIIILVSFIATGASAEVMALRNIDIGDDYPPFCVEQLNGPQVCSENFDNTILVAAFLKLAQKKSLKVIDSLNDLHARYKTSGVSIVGIVSGNDLNQQGAITADETSIAFPLLLDTNRAIYGSFGVFVYPTVIVLGQDGKLKYSFSSNTLNIETRLEGCIRLLSGEIDALELEKILHPVVEKIDREQAKAERYYNFARTAYDRKQFTTARKIVESSIGDHIAYAPTYALYGSILAKDGELEHALQQFERALAIDPSLAEAKKGRQLCMELLKK